MHSRHLLLPTLVLTAVTLPAPASATGLAPVAADTAEAIAAGGGGIAYTTRLPRLRVRTAAPGIPARTAYVFRPSTEGEFGLEAGVARTGASLAFGVARFAAPDPDDEPTPLGGEAFTGPLGGPFSVAAGGPTPTLTYATVVGVGDDVLVTFEAPREFGTGRVFARDLATGTAARQIGPDAVSAARVAGGNAAIWTAAKAKPGAPPAATVTVYDLTSGAARFAVDVPLNTDPEGRGSEPAFDIDTDGTVAVLAKAPSSTPDVPRVNLAIASPTAPALRVLREDAEFGDVAISGGRVLYRTRSATLDAVGAAALSITDLSGTATPVSGPLASPPRIDLDGDTVAVAAGGCVYVASLPVPTPGPTAPAGVCPQTYVSFGDVVSSRRGRLRAPVLCTTAARRGCRGLVVLALPADEKHKRLVLGRRTIAVAAQKRTTVTFTLSRRMLRRVLKRNNDTYQAVDLSVRTTDDAGRASVQETGATLRTR